MRQLTQTEIKTRPLWAKSYAIHAQSGEPMFYAYLGYGATPIPCEEFDIFSAKFNGEIGIEQADELSITITEYEQAVTIGINEAEIFAKHFGLIK